MLDLAWPTVGMPWWKPVGLLAFGVLIEVCQKMTGYRSFSVGDIVANGVGVLAYLGVAMGAADVVPGVSGGTIAFITGIYDELLDSIKRLGPGALKVLAQDGIAACWKHIN
ncbi:hypothetical protein CAPTEDRAFT_196432, partial [Capitella teleta]